MIEKKYFINPQNPIQKQYEALRAFHVEGVTAKEVEKKYQYSSAHFKKIRFEFTQALRSKKDNFFQERKRGPKKRSTNTDTIDEVIALRKKNHSIEDIKSILSSKDKHISLDTINNVLKDAGFSSLPRRTRAEISNLEMPDNLVAPKSCALLPQSEKFSTERGVGPLLFLPLIDELKIVEAIEAVNFPATTELSATSTIMSILALKLMGTKRYSHDKTWNFDRALGLFAKLNVLPKNATLSSYSYRVTRKMNRDFLLELSKIFSTSGDFNLDFKTIPHWGDKSVWEKNWSGSKTKVMKSVLAAIVQHPESGFLSYADAEVKRSKQNDVVLDFVDFWKEGTGQAPKMLVFDSKFTTYENLNKLDKSEDKIKFLTIRRNGKGLIDAVAKIKDEEWIDIHIDGKTRKHKDIKVYENKITMRKYDGELRQLIITQHGRQDPTFMITNDFKMPTADVVKKYARRWLVEQEIAEQVDFFHINNPSSSIVIKVDFDLTISLLAHNLYKVFSNKLAGFENCRVGTINRNFIENGADITIEKQQICVELRKKTHLPLLMGTSWFQGPSKIKWLNNMEIYFKGATKS